MVPAESSSSTLLLCGGGTGGCRGDLGGGLSESFGFMRLLQQVHEFSAVSEDDDEEDARLGSDIHHRNNIKDDHKVIKHIINNRNTSFMADQEEPRTNSWSSSKDDDHNNNNNNNTNTEADLDNNNNQDENMREEGWLRLSIGRQTNEAKPDDKKTVLDRGDQADPTARRDSMLELNLFSGGSSGLPGTQEDARPTLPFANTPGFGIGASLLHHHHHQGGGMMSPVVFPSGHEEMLGSWTAFRPPLVPQNLTPSPSLVMPLMGSYLARSAFQSQLMGTSSYTDVMMPGPSSSFRVIDPPRRPHSGIWFVLQASQNQAREPFLPQIPKSYLRIKDGRMTVRLLMKYLVNKLRLEHESEIEIRCRGEELEPLLTLQYVRDTIWRGRDINSHLTLLPNSSTSSSDHLMVLHYGRSLS